MTTILVKQVKWMSVALGMAVFSMTANATVIFSDDFSGGLSNWTGAVNVPGRITPDVVTNNAFCGGSGGTCLDMDGSGTNSNADISTSTPLALAAGAYTFSFDWGNNIGAFLSSTNNILNWEITAGTSTLASGFVDTGAANNNTYTLDSTAFTVTSAVNGAKIRMFQTGDELNDGGSILDNVSLSLDAPATVPEPGTVGLLGLGLLGLVIRRRKAKQV